MVYSIKNPKKPGKHLRKVARDQLTTAARELADEESDHGIHQARKRCKKVRALLRLARPVLGPAYGDLNRQVRDIARSLAGQRDAAAQLETLDDLQERYGEDLADEAFTVVRDFLQGRRQAVIAHQGLEGPVAQAAARLEELATTVGDWPLPTKADRNDLIDGLLVTYRRGRRALDQATSGSPDHVHEWRKRTKYLRYELRLLKRCWPGQIEALAKELNELGDRLGDHHDLAILRQQLVDLPDETAADTRTMQALVGVIDLRMAELLAEALPLGQRIWAEKPQAFGKRLRAYWRAWRATPKRPARAAALMPG